MDTCTQDCAMDPMGMIWHSVECREKEIKKLKKEISNLKKQLRESKKIVMDYYEARL